MLAEKLIAINELGELAAPFTDGNPVLQPADAYQAAGALHRHRLGAGWRPVGRKIGFTNRTIWPRYGVYEPIWGFVYDRTLVAEDVESATLRLAGLAQPRIEPEICFGLRSAPPPGSRAADLVKHLAWAAHSVEIVQCHHPDWKLKLADACADNGLHGRLVIGRKVEIAQLGDLEALLPTIEVVLKKGSQAVDRGIGANVLDSPLNALAYLVEVLASQPEAPPLAAGEAISTGTVTDAHPVAPGETWSTEIRGIGLPALTIHFS